MRFVFLGTSCMTPTKKRNHQAFFIKHRSEGILVDCGEGTQRQFKLAGIPLTKITKILISHWHGDHVFGLPGVIQSLAASEDNKKIIIYGPKGTKERFNNLFKAFLFDKKVRLEIKEIRSKTILDSKHLKIEAFDLDHKIECKGFKLIEKDKRKIKVQFIKKLGIPEGPLLGQLQENKPIKWGGNIILPKDATKIIKGKKIGIIPDTKLCNNCYKIAEGVDLLVCESTYADNLIAKAKKHMHMTSKEAALVASESGVGELILTHFSNRYKETQELKEEARVFFDKTRCAEDFMKIDL